MLITTREQCAGARGAGVMLAWSPVMDREEALDRLLAARVLMVVAHPDDETIGAGGRLDALALAAIVHVTDGAPRDPAFANHAGFATPDAYRAARRAELEAAIAVAGVPATRLVALAVPDQDACDHLVELTHRLEALIDEHAPAAILTHPYEGGHPDHDAAAFIVQAARDRLGPRAPACIEMAYYHRVDQALVCGAFLPGSPPGRLVTLSPAQRMRKQRMLACFASQRAVLATFDDAHERFRIAPRHDFTQRPHAGPLHYETLGWPATGARFCARAAEALDLLQIRRPARDPSILAP
jgi:LmbE family N-acetylglucosaminyl deacetylase